MAKAQKELSKALLDVLACPKCKGDLEYLKKQGKLVCKNRSCAREYKIENGIPIMLADEN